jgi:hypothetical protein
MDKNLELHFNILADTIANQLKNQKFSFNKKQINDLEKDLYSIKRLYFRHYISDNISKSLHKKLFKKVQEHVCMTNNLKEKK